VASGEKSINVQPEKQAAAKVEEKQAAAKVE